MASRELENELDSILSKFNVIGYGTNFNVEILENLAKSGSQAGVISSDIDAAFSKIVNEFEITPSTKVKIPGQAPINVPLTYSNDEFVTFETSIVLAKNESTIQALEMAKKEPATLKQFFTEDIDVKVKCE